MAEVQTRVDLAAQTVRQKSSGMTPQAYGTAVHYNVSQQLKSLNDRNFRAEVSFVKSGEENYGTVGSIRVDVYEKVSDAVLCIYDIKTGVSGLSAARKNEIRDTIMAGYGHNFPVVVITDIRPSK